MTDKNYPFTFQREKWLNYTEHWFWSRVSMSAVTNYTEHWFWSRVSMSAVTNYTEHWFWSRVSMSCSN